MHKEYNKQTFATAFQVQVLTATLSYACYLLEKHSDKGTAHTQSNQKR